MERTVPTTESQEVELYLRTYYSLLRSSAEVQIRTLEEAHTGMNSLLHRGARQPVPDMSAFIYSVLRLPECITQVRRIVLGQSAEMFAQAGLGDIFEWQEVTAPARRRRCFFDGKETLACFIASRSDIDDMVPVLTAYQIEWNKMHRQLHQVPASYHAGRLIETEDGFRLLAEILEISADDLDRLYAIWDEQFGERLERIGARPLNLSVRLLSGSLSQYRRATHLWWENIEKAVPDLCCRPVYFLSSNTHSLLNLITGFALQHTETLVTYLQQPGNQGLLHEWNDIQNGNASSSRENFLYYVLKKYQQTQEGKGMIAAQRAYEEALKIVRIPSNQTFDVEAQVIDLRCIDPQRMDPRLQIGDFDFLVKSDALLLNIDYPLGLSAYNILSEVAERVDTVLGVYAMGKAATLNATVGDVMIPNVVHDEHSQNTYLFPNCFYAADVSPHLVYGTVLDNQKAVTVQGTFLQNAEYMDVFYREGYTDIEMEAGPYLSAVYEMYRPIRHPSNEIVNLYGLPFDLGIIHYASDTPLSKGRNLGAGSLSYFGMDSTYAANLAVTNRIFELERTRLQGQRRPRG